MFTFISDLYHAVIWQLSRVFVYAVLRPKYGVKIEQGSDPVPPTPFIMVSNHGTFFDPWLSGGHSSTPLAIMMNDDGFRAGKFTRWYLKGVGAFPKKKGAHDFSAMKKTIQLLKRGKGVLIFPEGQTTWDGHTQPIFSGIEKIVKKAKCNLYMSRIKGNFLTKPWWAQTQRKGKVRIQFRTISREQIAQMTPEQILETIIDYIKVNDIEDPRNRQTTFKGHDLAAGLERLVWLCPHCKAEDSLETGGNKVTCKSCSSVITIDAHCKLFYSKSSPDLPENLYEWMNLHKQVVKNKIAATDDKALMSTSSDVLMQKQEGDGEFIDTYTGTLSLTKNELTFTPATNGAELKWPFSSVSDYVIQKKDIFEFHHNDTDSYFRFVFDHKSPMKWIYYLRYMNGYEQCERRGYV